MYARWVAEQLIPELQRYVVRYSELELSRHTSNIILFSLLSTVEHATKLISSVLSIMRLSVSIALCEVERGLANHLPPKIIVLAVMTSSYEL